MKGGERRYNDNKNITPFKGYLLIRDHSVFEMSVIRNLRKKNTPY